MQREQVQRQVKQREVESLEDIQVTDPGPLKEDLESLLDEIDSVLEENAQEFVDGYVQRGGQ